MLQLTEILFWLFAFIVFYTYVGYGLLIYLLVRIKEYFRPPAAPSLPPDDRLPAVTLFITAYNEAAVVDEKMRNSLALRYPADRLTILWVTDGSNDDTNKLLSRWPQARVEHRPQREGKTAAMNRGMTLVTTPLVVFTDANTLLNADALRALVLPFIDPRVGCVAGEKRIAMPPQGGAGGRTTDTEGFYWRYESALKALDARFYSVVGAAGELFAIRRELYVPMPRDTLLDDFTLALRIAMQGRVTAYCRDAYAVEDSSPDMAAEQQRKVRIAAGGLQAVWRLRALLNPFRYGRLCFQYLSHRVLRWTLTPLCLLLMLPLTICLLAQLPPLASSVGTRLYMAALLFQLCFYFISLLGYTIHRRGRRARLLFIPYYFLFMNLNVFRAVPYLYRRRGTRDGTWEKARRS
jgi:cellulose synthase/poly-beta-1,6-N-acetylglucosamine synthase-like glycosyltransferase